MLVQQRLRPRMRICARCTFLRTLTFDATKGVNYIIREENSVPHDLLVWAKKIPERRHP